MASVKDLSKIKNIKKKTAKKIKKEIEDNYEWVPDEEKKEEPTKESDYIIEEEVIEGEAEIIDEKIQEFKPEPIEAKEEHIEGEDVFKNVKSIDKKIATLLLENGINSIEILKSKKIKELTKIKGIKRKVVKKIKKDIEELSEEKVPKKDKEKSKSEEDTQIDEDKISDKKMKEIKGFRHGDYTLYEKEIDTKTGKKRRVRFFSKAEPDDAEPIELPKGFKVKENKKTGLPYLKKKK
jgi:hypothetical protein